MSAHQAWIVTGLGPLRECNFKVISDQRHKNSQNALTVDMNHVPMHSANPISINDGRYNLLEMTFTEAPRKSYINSDKILFKSLLPVKFNSASRKHHSNICNFLQRYID